MEMLLPVQKDVEQSLRRVARLAYLSMHSYQLVYPTCSLTSVKCRACVMLKRLCSGVLHSTNSTVSSSLFLSCTTQCLRRLSLLCASRIDTLVSTIPSSSIESVCVAESYRKSTRLDHKVVCLRSNAIATISSTNRTVVGNPPRNALTL